MHGGGVDLLDNAKTKALDFQVGDKHAFANSRCRTVVAEVANIRARAKAGEAEIATTHELVVILAPLAV